MAFNGKSYITLKLPEIFQISKITEIIRAGGRLAKAEGRRPDASAGRPCRPGRIVLAKSGHTMAGRPGPVRPDWAKRSPVRVGGLFFFCYGMYFKHDLPHDVG